MMGIFDKLAPTGQSEQLTPEMMRGEMNRIQHDPAAYLQQRGFSIPAGMTDPRQITQHLLRSGQVGNQRLQMVMRMLGK
jgi:hypothetical protein